MKHLYRDNIGPETTYLLDEYRMRFGENVSTLYLNFDQERDLQQAIRHSLRCGRPIPVRYE